MSENINILLYGLGAIGSFYSFILSRSKHVRLTVVARSNYAAVQQNGLTIESTIHGNHNFRPHAVVKTIEETSGAFDFIVFTHKALGQDSVPMGLARVTNPQTSIIIMQNGVGNEEPFRKELPGNTILTCSVWIASRQTEPGVILHTTTVSTPIGLYPNPAIDKRIEEERLSRFVELLRAGGTLVEIDENMQVRKWEKCVWNAAWNSLTALTMLDTHSWLRSSPEAMSVSRRLMREMISIARACQVAVASDLEDSLIEKVLSIPPIISSMQVDVKAGRLLEVEIIFGNPLRIAREHGLDVPTLQLIYALLTGINGRQLQSCP